MIFVSASFGNFDKNSRTLRMNIDSLKNGETKTFELRGKVRPGNELPANSTCQTNLASVSVNNMNCQATASFCSQKQVLGVTKTLPATGPTQTLPLLGASALLLFTGILIKKNFDF